MLAAHEPLHVLTLDTLLQCEGAHTRKVTPKQVLRSHTLEPILGTKRQREMESVNCKLPVFNNQCKSRLQHCCQVSCEGSRDDQRLLLRECVAGGINLAFSSQNRRQCEQGD